MIFILKFLAGFFLTGLGMSYTLGKITSDVIIEDPDEIPN